MQIDVRMKVFLLAVAGKLGRRMREKETTGENKKSAGWVNIFSLLLLNIILLLKQQAAAYVEFARMSGTKAKRKIELWP